VKGSKMALSDCEKCWDTPCTCGNNYTIYSKGELIKQINMLKNVLNHKIKQDLPVTAEELANFLMSEASYYEGAITLAIVILSKYNVTRKVEK
jgi:hypothetical protein